MKSVLEGIFHGGSLNREDAGKLIRDVVALRFPPTQIAALLAALRMRPVQSDELLGFVDGLRQLAVPVDLGGEPCIDICGTGGDGKNTFNISTIAALVLAGAGVKVAKHGNVGVSSACGSTDLLQGLGIALPKNPAEARAQFERCGICFLHAPYFHPALKAVAPIRKDLGVRTIFNLLGPLLNPAAPSAQLAGVAVPEWIELYRRCFDDRRILYTVVHTVGGYDEMSLTDEALVADSRGVLSVSPAAFGLEPLLPESLDGGYSIEDGVKIAKALLEGSGTLPQRSVVVANAALALHTLDSNKPMRDCVARAAESLASGSALTVLKLLQEAP